jgi:branched-chain amino acid transport system substrate-binding protein
MQGLTGGKDGLTWNESGEVTKSPKAVIIKNGAYKAM